MDEAKSLGALAGTALGVGTDRVAQLHGAIATRVFGNLQARLGEAAEPVRTVHDGISRAVYTGVSMLLRTGARAAGMAAAQGVDGRAGLAAPAVQPLLAALNAAHGDRLTGDLGPLALPMTLRHNGHDLPTDRDALAAAHPDPSGRLVLFVHGLAETDRAWHYQAAKHHGDPDTGYGELLRRDLGYAPLWLRYNTGRRISDNGSDLAALLDRLVAAWPVGVRELVLIGHSMGGLVIRSALAQAGAGADRGWAGLVSETVTLGSPHLGADLERGANRLTHLLRRVGETRWLADQLAARSAGIKDLRFGNLIEADWQGHDPDSPVDHRTDVPLPDGPRHFVVLATLGGRPDSPTGDLLGDLLGDLFVRPRSATGDTRDHRRLAYPDEHVLRLTGLHHFDLLNHPAVYAQLHDWLTAGVPQPA